MKATRLLVCLAFVTVALLLVAGTLWFAQKRPEKVVGEGFEGVIFPADNVAARAMMAQRGTTNLWTPSHEEVGRAETAVWRLLSGKETNRVCEVEASQTAFQKIAVLFPAYRRQYFGYADGDSKMLHIIYFVFDPRSTVDWESIPIDMTDGDIYFVRVDYDVGQDLCKKIRIDEGS
jgi:hypothetical protein